MKNIYPYYNNSCYTGYIDNGFRSDYKQVQCCNNDNRLGGFLVPFLTGAVVSAPFWFLGAQNRYQTYPPYYPYPPQQVPTYYSYPQYR